MEFETSNDRTYDSADDSEDQIDNAGKRVAQIVYENGEPKLIDGQYLFYYEETCEEFTLPVGGLKECLDGPAIMWRDEDTDQMVELHFTNPNDVKMTSFKPNFTKKGPHKPVNWNTEETKILIDSFRTNYENVKNGTFRKIKYLWEAIDVDLRNRGFYYTIVQIENRWKTLERSFRKIRDFNLYSGSNVRKTMMFYDELTDLVRPRKDFEPLVFRTVHVPNSMNNTAMDWNMSPRKRTNDHVRKHLSSLDDNKMSDIGPVLSTLLTEMGKFREEIAQRERRIARKHTAQMVQIRENNQGEKAKADMFELYVRQKSINV